MHSDVCVSNTSDSVLSGHPIFDEIKDVWIADKTLSRVFDISSQTKQLWSKR